MLAQNFKTAVELGLDDAEFSSLVRVLGMLERKEIPASLFKMDEVGEPECGTPGCIMGWAISVGFTRNSLGEIEFGEPVERLFLPGMDDHFQAYAATTSQAATALRNFLTTGEPRWEEAMSIAEQ